MISPIVNKDWGLKIMQGSVQFMKCNQQNSDQYQSKCTYDNFQTYQQQSQQNQQSLEFFQIIIISRRSGFRYGLFWQTRGLDQEGNSQNFVEYEIIIDAYRKQSSFLVLKGFTSALCKYFQGLAAIIR
ncbi:hypothetical protein PPERSA_03464 [Pseudocohnilembus persalinus]|uniref:SAC domain-containing protein n=1 Tax=Pseudocohnilembus persalinus TaxID=266149 RepID=A0A0V0QC10_PSEPJ|nr:hypothetical protein PPERSA_03464 [Pseudocohnilembus persalinus]|eukprot:KRW99663.1 hypothetical protein PPERSA_03464 [Pseudocohnilembus persalinus]